MKLGVVTGTVWATRKAKELEGCRLYVVQPVSSERVAHGAPVVAADPAGLAAPGDLIVYVTSTDASAAFPNGFAPVNASIVELVDGIG
jgi:ethanolamine utilization protein EutN